MKTVHSVNRVNGQKVCQSLIAWFAKTTAYQPRTLQLRVRGSKYDSGFEFWSKPIWLYIKKGNRSKKIRSYSGRFVNEWLEVEMKYLDSSTY